MNHMNTSSASVDTSPASVDSQVNTTTITSDSKEDEGSLGDMNGLNEVLDHQQQEDNLYANGKDNPTQSDASMDNQIPSGVNPKLTLGTTADLDEDAQSVLDQNEAVQPISPEKPKVDGKPAKSSDSKSGKGSKLGKNGKLGKGKSRAGKGWSKPRNKRTRSSSIIEDSDAEIMETKKIKMEGTEVKAVYMLKEIPSRDPDTLVGVYFYTLE